MADHSPSTAARRPLRLVPVLALVAGCATSADFEGRDEAGLYPTGRITFDLEDSHDSSDPLQEEDRLRWVAEVEGTAASGEIGRADYDIAEVTAGARLSWQERSNSSIHLLVGAAGAAAELDADGAAGFVEFDETNFGPYLGVDLRYRPSERFAVYGRAQNAWLLSDATSLRAELGTEIKLAGPLDLLVGYRWWRYVFDEDDVFSDDADAELRLRGVVAGLSLSF